MQRGCVSTLAASANTARERSPGSEIEAKADGDCKLVLGAGVCAELETEAVSAAQHSKVGSDTGRIMPGPSIAITTFPSGKKFIPNARFAVKGFGWRQIGAQSVLRSEIATGRRSPALPAVVKIPDASEWVGRLPGDTTEGPGTNRTRGYCRG